MLIVLTIQVIGCHQQLQAQLGRNLHVGNVFLVAVLVVVTKVFGHLFQDQTTIQKSSLARMSEGQRGSQGRWLARKRECRQIKCINATSSVRPEEVLSAVEFWCNHWPHLHPHWQAERSSSSSQRRGSDWTYLISWKLHLPVTASWKPLLTSSIRLIAPLWQAASRRTTYSRPSLETRVTYLLVLVEEVEVWSGLEDAMATRSVVVIFRGGTDEDVKGREESNAERVNGSAWRIFWYYMLMSAYKYSSEPVLAVFFLLVICCAFDSFMASNY